MCEVQVPDALADEVFKSLNIKYESPEEYVKKTVHLRATEMGSSS